MILKFLFQIAHRMEILSPKSFLLSAALVFGFFGGWGLNFVLFGVGSMMQCFLLLQCRAAPGVCLCVVGMWCTQVFKSVIEIVLSVSAYVSLLGCHYRHC